MNYFGLSSAHYELQILISKYDIRESLTRLISQPGANVAKKSCRNLNTRKMCFLAPDF